VGLIPMGSGTRLTSRFRWFSEPLLASADSNPRLHAGIAPIANTPPLVVWPRATAHRALVPLADLADRLPVRWGLDLGSARPAGDSAQVGGDFKEVLHKAKSPQIGGCVKWVGFYR